MSSSVTPKSLSVRSKRDTGGIICAALFILVGVACLYETTQMTDPDSYVFPRMVIAGLMGLSLLLIVNSVLKPYNEVTEPGLTGGRVPSTPRRVLLVVSMMGSTLLMPVIGFLLAGLSAFISLMLLAQYEGWRKSKLLLYVFVAASIVCGFYGVFSYLLNVPLPEGSLIQFP